MQVFHHLCGPLALVGSGQCRESNHGRFVASMDMSDLERSERAGIVRRGCSENLSWDFN